MIDDYAGKDLKKIPLDRQTKILKDTYCSSRFLSPLIKYFDSSVLRSFLQEVIFNSKTPIENLCEDKLVFLSQMIHVLDDEKKLGAVANSIVSLYDSGMNELLKSDARWIFSKLFSRCAKIMSAHPVHGSS